MQIFKKQNKLKQSLTPILFLKWIRIFMPSIENSPPGKRTLGATNCLKPEAVLDVTTDTLRIRPYMSPKIANILS